MEVINPHHTSSESGITNSVSEREESKQTEVVHSRDEKSPSEQSSNLIALLENMKFEEEYQTQEEEEDRFNHINDTERDYLDEELDRMLDEQCKEMEDELQRQLDEQIQQALQQELDNQWDEYLKEQNDTIMNSYLEQYDPLSLDEYCENEESNFQFLLRIRQQESQQNRPPSPTIGEINDAIQKAVENYRATQKE